MLNSGTNDLNWILNTGKSSSNKYGLDYSSSGQACNQKKLIFFVPAKAKRSVEENVITKKVIPLKANQVRTNHVQKKSKIWVCHHCGKHDHIRLFC